MTVPRVAVKAGHVQPLWAGHPWVFAQALVSPELDAEPGDEVIVTDPRGRVLGRGLWSPSSALRVRIFVAEEHRCIDQALFTDRIERAVARRRAVGLPDHDPGREITGYRLVHGEGDGLPGLTVDVYDDVLCVQLGTIGLKRREQAIVAALREVVGPRVILDRSLANVANNEGFEVAPTPCLVGELPEQLCFRERGISFALPMALSQKTGFYFDQRPLRARIERLARGSRVLDAYCYVGALSLSAARGGASDVWGIDRSASAIEAAVAVAADNPGADCCRFTVCSAEDAFEQAARDGGYDVVVCDPPKLSARRRHRARALSAYRKLARSACAATAVGGVLAFCSCSANVDLDSLGRALALGARDAGRRVTLFDRIFQGPDHPVPAEFPEGLYLRTLLGRVEAAR